MYDELSGGLHSVALEIDQAIDVHPCTLLEGKDHNKMCITFLSLLHKIFATKTYQVYFFKWWALLQDAG